MSFLEPDRLWFLLVIPALVVLYVVLQRRRGSAVSGNTTFHGTSTS